MSEENPRLEKCERCGNPITRNPDCTCCTGKPRYSGGAVGSMPPLDKTFRFSTVLLCDACINDFWGVWMKNRPTITQTGYGNTQIGHVRTLTITN